MKVRKINLDLQSSIRSGIKTANKINVFKEVSSKRLKYCYRKKQLITSTDNNNLSNQFSDHKYFSTPKSQINVVPMNQTSNLLTKSRNESFVKETQQMKIQKNSKKNHEQDCDVKNIEDIQVNYINFPSKRHLNNRKSHSYRQQNAKLLQNQSEQKQSKNKNLKINPYTNQEYLHFKKKQKEKIQNVLTELRKYEHVHNILKPCQIFQKQLNNRDNRRPSTIRLQRSKGMTRSKTVQNVKKDNLQLEPWIISQINNDDFF